MRCEIRTALAVLSTAVALLGSATMAIAADSDAVEPDPAVTTTASASPDPTDTSPTPEPTETTATPEVPSGAFTVTDAQLRWGINNESNNAAFAPATYNFFSAGKIANPGRGGVKLTQSGWSSTSGNVRIEKFAAATTSWNAATWAGLSTDSNNRLLTTSGGTFSNHEVVISGGTGTVDPAAGSATIQWTGSFTVLYYSGYSFFYVTDPTLTVTGGIGRLTGTLSGYGSSMDDLQKWEPVAPVPNVVLADLGPVDLAADLGFSATPAYAGVAVSIPAGQAAQVRSGSTWGSFPQSFVNYQLASGSGAYWYSSGGSADAHKAALPVTVSYAAGVPVMVTPKPSKGNKTPDVTNDAPERPDASSDPAVNPNVGVVPPAALAPPVPATADAVQAGSALTQFRPASTITGVVPTTDEADTNGMWILGGILLAAAALLAAGPFAYSQSITSRSRTER